MNEIYKSKFKLCMYELKYEYNVKEDWEMSDDDNYVWTDESDDSDVFSDDD